MEETGADSLTEVADELAHRIVLDTARLPHLEGSGTSSTRDWKAFRALTRAIRRWEAADFRVDDAGSFGEVDALLERALKHDPGYALAWYNRGALHMSAFQGASEIDEDVVTAARQAAQEAVTLLGREDPAAMQALAFAWHCTERLDDIRKGTGG